MPKGLLPLDESNDPDNYDENRKYIGPTSWKHELTHFPSPMKCTDWWVITLKHDPTIGAWICTDGSFIPDGSTDITYDMGGEHEFLITAGSYNVQGPLDEETARRIAAKLQPFS